MRKKFLPYILLLLASASFVPVSGQVIKKIKAEELADYIRNSNHPLIVNFWATWCAPCIAELPYFQEEVKKYADQKAELVLVSLDFADAYPVQISNFIKKKKFEATFFWLNESDADHFCPVIEPKWTGSIPSTLFINNQKGFRKFYERQLTHPQFVLNMQELVK
ncbi:MAG TPA: TlpA disulfide reductase family protein [Chitinophagaceae bacterium]